MSLKHFTGLIIMTSIYLSIAEAATLQVYQDKTLYNYTPTAKYIGFTRGVEAKCDGLRSVLVPLEICPTEARLCKDHEAVKKEEMRVESLQTQLQTLQTLASLPQPSMIDATNMIKAAREIGEEKSGLIHKQKEHRRILGVKMQHFSRQIPAESQALGLNIPCRSEVELTLPRTYVEFSTNYEADLAKKKEITVTQYLSIINRSGIDIEADDAMFYYHTAEQYLNPLHFNPWILSAYKPSSHKKKRIMQKNKMDTAIAPEDMISLSSASEASYKDAREYKLRGLKLPSTGVPMEVKVLEWKAPLECELRAYPFRVPYAFEVCSFKPKYQIDGNRWKLKKGDRIINDNATGEYYKGHYDLYVKIDKDLKIVRKPIVKKEKEAGIFGSTIQKKDGYSIEVINKSDKSKRVKLIERIPTSTTDKIEVKLIKVQSDSKIEYQKSKEGKIEIYLDLKPHERKKIDIWFSISHDKGLKVNY